MTVLAIASVLALATLVAHSLLFLPRRRAVAFWSAVALYGILRGVGVRFITERLLGASAPYVMHGDGPSLAGVPAQEIVGWAIVTYLGWWLGWRFSRSLDGASLGAGGTDPRRAGAVRKLRRGSRAPHAERAMDASGARHPGTERSDARLFPQVLWACLFLGAIGWTVETAAGAAGWWGWTLPGSPLLLGVPAIGLLDWAFTGIDFVLPFLAITSPCLAGRPARWLTLGAFPLHFLAHASVGSDGPFRTLALFGVHAALFGGLLWMALSSRVRDASFAESRASRDRRAPGASPADGGRDREREETPTAPPVRGVGTPASRLAPWTPLLALCVLLGVPLVLETLVLGRPSLLVSLVPSALVAAASLAPWTALGSAAAAAVLSIGAPPLALAVVPGGIAMLVRWAAPDRRIARGAAVLALAAIAVGFHIAGVRRESALRGRLDEAVEARDRGDLETARSELRRISRDYPSSHAPRLLLGEIAFHRDDLREARDAFEAALAIKPDAVLARRYLAALALRQGKPSEAADQCARGLATAPDDADLRQLASIAAEAAEASDPGVTTSPISR